MNKREKARSLIARASELQRTIDPRPSCGRCGYPLVKSDYVSYWDGSVELERQNAQPEVCEDCAETEEE